MRFQKGHKINNGRTPWNKGKKGISTGGRKKTGKEIVCKGCGVYFYKQPSKIAKYDDFHTTECFKEYVKNNKERSWSKDVYKKNSGENNHNHKGIMATYSSIHKGITYRKGRPDFCNECGAMKDDKKLQWANQSGLYLDDLDDFVGKCYSCHKKYDTRQGFLRKESFDEKGRRIGITIFVPEEYLKSSRN